MTNQQLVIAVLSSSLLGGVFGAFITGKFNLRVKDREYENEYFKLVLAKRITAYESVQKLVTGFKTAVVDKDKQPYHLLLSHEDGPQEAHKLLFEISSQALWLTDDLFLRTRDISRLLFGASGHEDGSIAFAIKNYRKFALLREEIERLHTRDMLLLHEVRKFLRKKKFGAGFNEVQLGN